MLWNKIIGAGGAGGGDEGWDVSAAVFLQSFNLGAASAALGVSFKPDGTKMYISDAASKSVIEYNIGTAWDISTASFSQSVVTTTETSQRGLYISPDGANMYLVQAQTSRIVRRILSAPWDVVTPVPSTSFTYSGVTTNVTGLFFKPDGTKMYLINVVGDKVNEYNLSTAWDITTAVFVQGFSYIAAETVPWNIFFKPDGAKMYLVGSTADSVYEYDLSVAWNVSTAVFLQSFSVAAQNTDPRSLFFKPDGTKMYVVGASIRFAHEYDLG